MDFKIKKILNKGLTNFNYLDTENNFIRKSQPFTNLFLDHKQEQYILNLIADQNITLPIQNSFFKDTTFYLVTKYYDDLKTLFDIAVNITTFEKIAHLIKSLHSIDYKKHNIEMFDPFVLLQKFKSNIKNMVIDLSSYEAKINKQLAIIPQSNITICHNDLTKGNIVFLNEKIYLIDFEYSGLNDYLFDIASLASESLDNKNDINAWIDIFSLNNIEVQRVYDWMYLQNILWTYWANYMYEKTNNPTFLEIIHDKVSKLTNQSF